MEVVLKQQYAATFRAPRGALFLCAGVPDGVPISPSRVHCAGDAQKTFDLLASKDKELFWIEGTTRRFKDGYNYFGRHPEKVLGFFDKHIKQTVDSKKSGVEKGAVAYR